jgi:hypothetical protein
MDDDPLPPDSDRRLLADNVMSQLRDALDAELVAMRGLAAEAIALERADSLVWQAPDRRR